jgi:hypothetical protein
MMSQIEKLIAKFMSNPKDFKYAELCRIMNYFGYAESDGGKTSGSCVHFTDPGGIAITIHKPHPGDEIPAYAVRAVLTHLKERGHLS